MAKVQIGDSVKCVDGKIGIRRTDPFQLKDLEIPKEDEIYTIRKVVKTSYGSGVRLEEVENKEFFYKDLGRFCEPVFRTDRFKIINQNGKNN